MVAETILESTCVDRAVVELVLEEAGVCRVVGCETGTTVVTAAWETLETLLTEPLVLVLGPGLGTGMGWASVLVLILTESVAVGAAEVVTGVG